MNKKKLTLLIALSIIIITTVTTFIVEAVKPEIKVEPIATVEDIDPLPPSAVEESVIEEEKIEVIIEEPKVELSSITLSTGEYPEARLIWNIMTSWGWTPETCAGIIGNMMAEVGQGNKYNPTSWLNLDWDSDGGCGYGLIQWTGGRQSTIKGRYGSYPTIEQQLIFMRDELFGTNSTQQQVNSSVLNKIMNTNGNETPESIAFCFASNYERCAEQYRAKRQEYARIAYDYFMSK